MSWIITMVVGGDWCKKPKMMVMVLGFEMLKREKLCRSAKEFADHRNVVVGGVAVRPEMGGWRRQCNGSNTENSILFEYKKFSPSLETLKKFVLIFMYKRPLDGENCSSQRISQISSSTIYTISDDLASGVSDVKTIEELVGSSKGGVCESEDEILDGEPSTHMSRNKIRKVVKQENE
ncbi:hypothetical protein Fot_28105 [Forsythia ovata]|uniref:Uncharacterized protein n=1 Tax=Forsythia ovata TaxID=205694 RepID=A0ABD1TN58_9LAMI